VRNLRQHLAFCTNPVDVKIALWLVSRPKGIMVLIAPSASLWPPIRLGGCFLTGILHAHLTTGVTAHARWPQHTPFQALVVIPGASLERA